ncbi:hypothetical protein BHM03_00035728 [Ensete ventricosum]|nr:hypothetical protein BHM03_00035728 [Ensete ventricosum]
MTIVSISPDESKGQRRGKRIVDEKVPLLPSKQEVTGEFDEFNGASFAGAVFNLSTTIVGAGIMSLPATMKVLGLVPGILLIVFFAFFTEQSIDMLIRSSRAGKTVSYGGVMGDTFGKTGKVLIQLYSLRYTSALSVALAVVFVVITAGIAVVKLLAGSIAMPKLFPDVPDLASVWNFFTVVPILVTAYICHYNVHPIENELEDPSQIKPVVRASLTLCSTVYITTSFFGFLLFGESTLDDVLANFSSNLGIPYSSVLNDAVRVSYAVHLMLVFPMIFHALRLNVDGLLFPSASPLASDNRRFAIITVVLLSIIFLAANFIPSIWDAFQFTGATAAVCIGFIFPAAITLRDPHGIATKWGKILAVFMIVLAVLSNAIAIYSDAYALFNKTDASPES